MPRFSCYSFFGSHDFSKWSEPIEVKMLHYREGLNDGKGIPFTKYKQRRSCSECGYVEEHWIEE